MVTTLYRVEQLMTTLYKLTDQHMRTFGCCQWKLGEPHEATGGDRPLCTNAWLHAYTDPLLAVLLNPIHADVANPRLFRCEGQVGQADYGLKVGCTKLTLLEEIQLPTVTTEQRVKFGILCACPVTTDHQFHFWAHCCWLNGSDRSVRAAHDVYAARDLDTTRIGRAADKAVLAAYYAALMRPGAAAESAARAAERAARDGGLSRVDLIAIAHEACQ